MRSAIVAGSAFPTATGYGPASAVSMVMVGDGAANDLSGSRAGDVLIGSGGQDMLRGGLGADLFVFEVGGDSIPTAPSVADRTSPSRSSSPCKAWSRATSC